MPQCPSHLLCLWQQLDRAVGVHRWVCSWKMTYLQPNVCTMCTHAHQSIRKVGQRTFRKDIIWIWFLTSKVGIRTVWSFCLGASWYIRCIERISSISWHHGTVAPSPYLPSRSCGLCSKNDSGLRPSEALTSSGQVQSSTADTSINSACLLFWDPKKMK